MAKLSFRTLSFQLKKVKDEQFLQVNLLNLFMTKIPLAELNKISSFKVVDAHTIEFKNLAENKAETKFSFLLSKYFDTLINTINGNKAIYIHQNSEIPLIGNVSFGIAYRNTSLIEIKPITSCNLNCIYCSISEGKESKKNDFVVEKDYLITELQKLLDYVAEPVEIHIGVQGEPFLYADLIPLIEDLQKNKPVKIISLNTNFTLATKTLIDQLVKFDKLRINISLDALDPQLSKKMAGCEYNLESVLKNIKYAVDKKLLISLAPVYLPGYNDAELEKIIQFAKELGILETKSNSKNQRPVLGFQNFLNYKTGRNPVKAIPWPKFYQLLSELEKKTGVSLKLSPDSFGIHPTKVLPKPFQEGDIVNAVIKSPDRFPHTCLAVANNRVISVSNCEFKMNKKVKIKITRDKHNIFVGSLI